MSVLRGWQRGHVVARSGVAETFFLSAGLGGNRGDETENKPTPQTVGLWPPKRPGRLGRLRRGLVEHRPGGSDRLRDVLCFSGGARTRQLQAPGKLPPGSAGWAPQTTRPPRPTVGASTP